MSHSHALDVRFVNDRFLIRNIGAVVALPVEEGVDDNGEHGVAERVILIAPGPGGLGVNVVRIQ